VLNNTKVEHVYSKIVARDEHHSCERTGTNGMERKITKVGTCPALDY